MAASEGEVTIQCGENEPMDIDISEVRDPENIKMYFDLNEAPKYLIRIYDNNKLKITPLSKLESGAFYKIPPKFIPHLETLGTNSSSTETEEQMSVIDDVEHVQNTLYCSKAVYKEDPISFLNESGNQLMHSIQVAQVSEYGPQKIILGESPSKKTLYVGFRGSKTVEDWMTNLKIPLKKKDHFPGKCHSGFLQRGNQLPAHYIVQYAEDNNLDTIITCGHSLGGAVSSVMALNLLHLTDGVEGNTIQVFNMTFGAPYFGNIDLQQYCQNKGYNKRLFHFTNKLDIVPTILSLSHSFGDICRKIDKEVSNATGGLSNVRVLEAANNQYGKFISGAASIMSFVLSQTSPTPTTDAIKTFLPILKEVFVKEKPINLDCNLGDKEEYIPNGTYKISTDRTIIELTDPGVIKQILQTATKSVASFAQSVEAHFIGSYESQLQTYLNFKKIRNGETLNQVRKGSLFKPSIFHVELQLIENRNGGESSTSCNLNLTGKNIFPLIPNINFGFGLEYSDQSTISKEPMGNLERVKLKTLSNENMKDAIRSISQFGEHFEVTTPFGSCSFTLRQQDVINIDFNSTKDEFADDKIANIIRKVVQREVALESIKEGGSGIYCIFLKDILLSDLLSLEKRQKFLQLIRNRNEQSIIENQQSHKELDELCNTMASSLSTDMNLKESSHVDRRMAFLTKYLFPLRDFQDYHYLHEHESSSSMKAPAPALAPPRSSIFNVLLILFESITASSLLSALLGWSRDLETEENYQHVLKDILLRLKTNDAIIQALPQDLAAKINTLSLDEGNPIIHELVLASFYDAIHSNGEVRYVFQQHFLNNFTDASKHKLATRIGHIRCIHNLRKQLTKTCFIGFVGRQNAGKSTIVNKIWNLKAPTGPITHTGAPNLYTIDDKLHIIDYPGSSSIENHAHSARLCGSMNNLIFVVLPFEGNIDKHTLEEVKEATMIMKASGNANIVFCFNRCFHHIDDLKSDENMKEKLQTYPIMFDAMREIYTENLNKGFLKSKETEEQLKDIPTNMKNAVMLALDNVGEVCKENILFTDWKMGDCQEARAVGISGVEDIKNIIKKYLVDNGIYEDDDVFLEACLNPKE